jgi:LuxR family transcriptional regulator, maltose regulon positive regulatory protein
MPPMIDAAHKVAIPQRPAHLVARPRLRTIVETVATRQLVLLTAPAGYGKTSLLVDWAHSATSPVCWYSLDHYDADPQTFLATLALSLVQRYPGRVPLTAALIQSASSWETGLAVGTIGREIAELGELVILVFDDWHLVDHVPAISGALADILRRAANCRAILASRSYPSVPNIMLLTAHGQVTGLAEVQLRFTTDEAAAVLARQSPRAISAPEAAALTERANGWITAIVLMARAPELAAQAAQAIGSGSERRVYEFLTEQVFDQLDPELRAFLCDSALLAELRADQCDELLGRSDSGMMLDRLLRQHLFVSEIDGGVLRYHPLFREFLLERYRRDQRSAFQRTALRIAEAYAERELWAQAFDLCLMADDQATAGTVLARGGEQLFHQGQLATLARCFEALPLSALSATLLCLKGRLYLSRGETQEAAALADLAQARMRPEEAVDVHLFQAISAQSRGDYHEALARIDEALTLSPSEEQRATALGVAVSCRNRLDEPEAALQLLREALQIQKRRGDLYQLAVNFHDLGMLYERMGQLREAQRAYQQAEGYWTTIGNVGARALSRNSGAVVLHMLGQYEEAYAQLVAAMQDAQTAQVPTYLAAIAASLGDLYADLGLWGLAEDSYQQARQARGSAFIQGYVELASLWLLARQRRFGPALAGLQRLEKRTANRHAASVALLQAVIACGQQRLVEGRAFAQQARERAGSAETVEAVRARLVGARTLMEGRLNPADTPQLLAMLDEAVDAAARMGYDAFLVAELVQHPALLRHAAALGWAPATSLLERVAELRLVAQRVSGQIGLPILSLRALGGDLILLNDAPLDLGLRKAREVLYYLLAHPHGATAETLRDALWPDRDETSARYLLRTAVHQLRGALPPEVVTMLQRRTYRLERSQLQLQYDVEQFLALTEPSISDPDTLSEGLDLYGGEFLPWCDSDWSQELRASLEQRFVQALHRAGRSYEELERYPDALRVYGRALALDPLDEAATAGLMRCHIAQGNRAAAIDSYQRTRQRLSDDLGLAPDPDSELEQIYLQIARAVR